MLKIICVAYARPLPLQILATSFQVQTNPEWELQIIYDGPAPAEIKTIMSRFYDDPRVRLFESAERYQKYGHPNRRRMLERLDLSDKDYVLMTNDDNYYIPVFVAEMLKMTGPDVGMVYCDTVHSHGQYRVHHSKLMVAGIDTGAFIVRIDVAKRAGFNSDVCTADGIYAVDCSNVCDRMNLRKVYIEKPYFIHN